jgi:hypothetical protein
LPHRRRRGNAPQRRPAEHLTRKTCAAQPYSTGGNTRSVRRWLLRRSSAPNGTARHGTAARHGRGFASIFDARAPMRARAKSAGDMCACARARVRACAPAWKEGPQGGAYHVAKVDEEGCSRATPTLVRSHVPARVREYVHACARTRKRARCVSVRIRAHSQRC